MGDLKAGDITPHPEREYSREDFNQEFEQFKQERLTQLRQQLAEFTNPEDAELAKATERSLREAESGDEQLWRRFFFNNFHDRFPGDESPENKRAQAARYEGRTDLKQEMRAHLDKMARLFKDMDEAIQKLKLDLARDDDQTKLFMELRRLEYERDPDLTS